MANILVKESGIANDVFEAVKALKDRLTKDLEKYEGTIWIIPSMNLHIGTGTHDLDIVMLGYLDNYYQDIANKKNIAVKSFCTTIEVKSHTVEGIKPKVDRLSVMYGDTPHDVTQQSQNQRDTLRSLFEDVLQYKYSPFISNLIWLIGATSQDFADGIHLFKEITNVIFSDATTEELFSVIGRQIKLKDNGFIDAFKHYSIEEIHNIADLFFAKQKGVDGLSLRRINLLKNYQSVVCDLTNRSEQVIVLSGHAGTGKTIIMLQAALKMLKLGKRCLFLTFNTALIADLKHTLNDFSYDSSNELELNSMHSFIISILYANKLWKSDNNLNRDFLGAVASLNRLKEIKTSSDINYDYVFIDEAQDWQKPIPDAIKHIFKQSKIVIADGLDQFMQESDSAQWGDKTMPKLKRCLRQRRNLTVFTKLFACKQGVYWDVEPNNDLPGGKIIVCTQYNPNLHNELVKDLKSHACQEYDMMLLAPNSMIENGSFSKLKAYESFGINLYDGTNKEIRDGVYSDENRFRHESRIYAYESCRGLEAWTTVCLRFDELFTIKHSHSYDDIKFSSARNYMLTLWSLIPLTRAVDTLVLHVSNNSEIYEILKEIQIENPDLIDFK